ncbi:predicted protein [Nematostella vectensis]|uniref:Uncharacterized protein n=1 Tax=Nematostella vectensis TaxID=45351 RepID=A7SE56_NEMVE|nr:predicted protein [Nematostella vectensis]|eukprot:XP_001630113.1 predicted protein [Nematostella vectensis]
MGDGPRSKIPIGWGHAVFFALYGSRLEARRSKKGGTAWEIIEGYEFAIDMVCIGYEFAINMAAVVKKISVALTCSTMRKLVEPKAHYQVKPSEVRDVLLSVSVLPAHYHYGNEVRKHRCLLSTWTEDSSSYVACMIEIPVWPNGLFYYKCNQYSIGQLTVTESTSRSGTKIKLLNTGEVSLFMVNSTCEPAISTLTHTNKFKRLDSEEDWNLDFPASCDGRIGMNYKGNCKVRVFHVCLKTITFIKEVQFPFKDVCDDVILAWHVSSQARIQTSLSKHLQGSLEQIHKSRRWRYNRLRSNKMTTVGVGVVIAKKTQPDACIQGGWIGKSWLLMSLFGVLRKDRLNKGEQDNNIGEGKKAQYGTGKKLEHSTRLLVEWKFCCDLSGKALLAIRLYPSANQLIKHYLRLCQIPSIYLFYVIVATESQKNTTDKTQGLALPTIPPTVTLISIENCKMPCTAECSRMTVELIRCC